MLYSCTVSEDKWIFNFISYQVTPVLLLAFHSYLSSQRSATKAIHNVPTTCKTWDEKVILFLLTY